jgi:hypothetical protein
VTLGNPANINQFETSIIRALQDRYRCPDEFLKYCLSGEICPKADYFTLDSSALCYGRTVGGTRKVHLSSGQQADASDFACQEHSLKLPFDPDEVIDNLRLERYSGCQLSEFEKILKDGYYRIRHLTNPIIRTYIQRFRAANWTKKRFPQWPVDTTVENISEALLAHLLKVNGHERLPFIWFWPNRADACVTITHDVEDLAGKEFCSELMDLDESFGFRSSFQIVPEGRYAVSQKFLNGIRARGFELCVQDLNHDGRLFDELGQFRQRAALINRFAREHDAKGFRSAVLYRNPEWFKYLDFSYDMSMPNVAHLDPQHGGCCTVTPYFIGGLVELPLTTVQDYMLFHYLKQRSADLWRQQIEMILTKNGLVTLLIHPDYIVERDSRGVYTDLLAMLNELRTVRHLWFALPGEVASWWRQRNQMNIVRNHGGWRISGDGADRARLVFAKIANGRLVYELADTEEGESHSGQAKTSAAADVGVR